MPNIGPIRQKVWIATSLASLSVAASIHTAVAQDHPPSNTIYDGGAINAQNMPGFFVSAGYIMPPVYGWQGWGGGGASNSLPEMVRPIGAAAFTSNQGDPAKGDANVLGCSVGNPVVIATGNKIEPEMDFASHESEMPLFFQRTYNALWNGVGIMGRQWVTNFDYKLSFDKYWPYESNGIQGACYPVPGGSPCTNAYRPTTIYAHRPDGRKIKFIQKTGGWYEDKPSPIARLVADGAGGWILYSEEHTVEHYATSGLITSLADEQGVGWNFTYGGVNGTQLQRVTHSNGRNVTLSWSGSQLVEVTDPANHIYKYYYNPVFSHDYVLTKAVFPGSRGDYILYYYGNPSHGGLLTGKAYNGVRYSTFSYDGNFLAASTEHSGGVEKYSFVYTLDSNRMVVRVEETNPLKKKTTYEIKNGKILSVTGAESANCAASYKQLEYSDDGYLIFASDFRDGITSFVNDSYGHVTKQTEATGTEFERVTTYNWDLAHNRLSSKAMAGLKSVSYSYESSSRLQSVVEKNISSAGIFQQTHTTTFTYAIHPNGLLASVKVAGATPTGAVTYKYDSYGELTSVVDALGHVVQYGGYNNLGLPGYSVGYNGDRTEFTYDERGRLTKFRSLRNGAAADTSYEYDGFGRLSRVTRPDGHTHSYQYDVAGRLMSEYEPEGGGTYAQTVYTYNAMSLPTSIKKQRVYAEPLRGTVP